MTSALSTENQETSASQEIILNLGSSQFSIDEQYRISAASLHKTEEAMLIIYNRTTTKVQYLHVNTGQVINLEDDWIVAEIYTTNNVDSFTHPPVVRLIKAL